MKAGDVIVEFDPSEQEFALEQADFDLQLADQEIAKAEAEAAVQAADDEVALLKARFDVRRAELDANANELVGAIVAKQNLLLLDEAAPAARAARRGREEPCGPPRWPRARCCARSATRRRWRSRSPRRNIENLRIRAPFDGFVTLRPNMMAFGGVVFGGADAGVPRRRHGQLRDS